VASGPAQVTNRENGLNGMKNGGQNELGEPMTDNLGDDGARLSTGGTTIGPIHK
jgi:hypothetical protein